MQHTQTLVTAQRLESWRLFFESAQAEANGMAPTVANTDPRLVPAGAPESQWGVDALLIKAQRSDVAALRELGALVDLMAENYTLRDNAAMFDALMQDDAQGAPAAPVSGGRSARVTLDELDCALSPKSKRRH